MRQLKLEFNLPGHFSFLVGTWSKLQPIGVNFFVFKDRDIELCVTHEVVFYFVLIINLQRDFSFEALKLTVARAGKVSLDFKCYLLLDAHTIGIGSFRSRQG